MSIKRRLYISNILMIVLPALLLVVTNLVVYLTFIGVTGLPLGKDISQFERGSAGEETRILFIFYLAIMVIVVLMINVILTRRIFKSIMTPLNTLIAGVHEIRDGNLDYRIEYQGTDEFSTICDDFNEMGARLSEMAEQKVRDERSRRELIAGISHDLRTPLTSIKAYLEGLEKGLAKTPEAQEKYFKVIKSKTENLGYIINQLFVFSKLDVGDFPLTNECVDIADELRAIVESLNHEHAGNGLEVLLLGDCLSVSCMVDAVQFENVVHNIIANSLSYKDKECVTSELSYTCKDGWVEICIADNGPGVSEANFENLFEIFFREDASRNRSEMGSGIGLAISKKIIEQFGGSISAKNRAEGGLLVSIRLPVCETQHACC